MLVTGDQGFIGRALANRAIFTGYDLKNGQDIRNPLAVRDAVEGRHNIVHLAAISGVMDCEKDPIIAVSTNVQGSVNVLEALKQNGGGKVLLASSGAVNAPTHVYAATKRAMEDLGQVYGKYLDVSILRFTNIYGPGSWEKSSAIAMFCKQALTTKEIIIYGDGEQTRDFIYIDDVVDAIIDRVNDTTCWPVYIVGSNTQTSLNSVAQLIAEKTGATIRHKEERPNDVRTNAIPRDLPCCQTNINLEEGIDNTLAYFEHELGNH